MPEAPDPAEIGGVFRDVHGRAIAALVRAFGDISMAEEAVQEAFAEALARWPRSGLPPSPAGWIITTARNRAIDRFRRAASLQDRHAQAAMLAAAEPFQEPDVDDLADDHLRLIFTCCHPALGPEAQVALTLRLLARSRHPRSPAPSWSPRRPWPSACCGPRARSATPPSPTGSRTRTSVRRGSARCWAWST